MIITKPGRYRLLDYFMTRNNVAVCQLVPGTIITINQIDTQYHHVHGPELYDWANWDIPAEPIEDAPSNAE
jgi:hypothetical protein